jgi:hydrogenase maturation protease
MTTAAVPVVVLGLGNVLLRDDGVGVRVVEELRRLAAGDPAAVPEGTRMVDGGTLGLGLLGEMRGAASLLLLDAVNLGQDAGTVSVLRGDAIAATGGPGAGALPGSVGELLSVARLMGWLPDPVVLVGVQAGDTGIGMGLSPRVEAAVADAVETARVEIRALDGRPAAGRAATRANRHQEEATA